MPESDSRLQAVILAAGFARRMQPLSDNSHKGLLTVSGDTILGRIMDNLLHVGIKRVTVVTGYLAEDVESYLRQRYADVDLRFIHNPRYRETNNVVSLSLAYDNLTFDADVIQVECDLIFDPTVLRSLIEHPGDNVALVDAFRTGMDGTVVEIEDGFVTNLYTGATQDVDFSFHNKFKTLKIYRFERTFCHNTLRPLLHSYANEIDASCFYELVLGMLTSFNKRLLHAEIVAGERWAEVDDPNDIAIAPFQFEPDRRPAILDEVTRGHWNIDIVDHSNTRNAYFPSGTMLAMMRNALPDLVADLGSSQSIVNEKLSFFLRCRDDRLQVINGRSQALALLSQILTASNVALPTPTFEGYARAFPTADLIASDPHVGQEDLSSVAPRYDVFIIANPSMPSGTVTASEEIHFLARATPDTLFWVDESHLEFSGQPSLVRLLEDDPLDNVLVLDDLSSRLGVPGLRLGYVYSCNAELLRVLKELIPQWNVTAPAEFLIELLVKFTKAYSNSIIRTIEDRAEMSQALADVPMVSAVTPSGGNYLLVTLTGSDPSVASDVRHQLLKSHRIEVRDVSLQFPDAAPRLLVALRSSTDNDYLVNALRALPDMSGHNAGRH